jgi:hypothetical protein
MLKQKCEIETGAVGDWYKCQANGDNNESE